MALSGPALAVRHVACPVRTLGPGRRLVLWTQGCSIRCPGCIAVDSWKFDPARELPVRELFEGLRPFLSGIDGLTISGGEPLDQAEGLHALLMLVQRHFPGDTLVYSGYPEVVIRDRWPWMFQLVDALITEPYQAAAGQSLPLRGSDNQTLHRLTARARRLYPEQTPDPAPGARRPLELFTGESGALTVGIHLPGHRRALRTVLATHGYRLGSRE